MDILLIIAYSLLAALAVWAAYWFFKDPGHFLLLDNKYRMMVRIRECYLKGQKAQPQDSEGYFLRKATKIINDYKPVFGPIEIKADLRFHKETVTNMLSRKEYYQYYFTQDRFNLAVFRKMYEDYRSGVYATYPSGAKKEQQLALAASMMCDHAGVNKYSELFGSYWGIKPSTMRSNKRNALESVDGASIMMEIKGILG